MKPSARGAPGWRRGWRRRGSERQDRGMVGDVGLRGAGIAGWLATSAFEAPGSRKGWRRPRPGLQDRGRVGDVGVRGAGVADGIATSAFGATQVRKVSQISTPYRTATARERMPGGADVDTPSHARRRLSLITWTRWASARWRSRYGRPCWCPYQTHPSAAPGAELRARRFDLLAWRRAAHQLQHGRVQRLAKAPSVRVTRSPGRLAATPQQ